MPTLSDNIIKAGLVVEESNVNNLDYTVTETAQLISTDDQGVFRLLGSQHDLTIRGYVSGGDAIRLGDGPMDSGNDLVIAATGDVNASGKAVTVASHNSTILNLGRIVADGVGIDFTGSGTIDNRGNLRSDATGILVNTTSVADGDIVIKNSGQLSGGGVAIGITGADDQTVRITNSGTIVGSPFIDPAIKVALLDFAGGKTVITNTGTIDGLLALGNGNDTVTNVGGTIRGTIAGNDGSDVFVLGLGSETVNGGGGTDLLDFSGGAGLRVVLNDLDGSGNSGRAKDDHYTGIERVIGSATGADTLVGDNAANRLSGLGGADELRGGIGADRLIGGEGVDTLKGGTGGDFFRFNARGEGGDAIVDFEVSGNDVIEIDASSFGGGLTAGQSLDGILQFGEFDTAAFAATRFVFNITNAKLWFDSNGSASGGRVLVADLQDSAAASFDADDILLI